MGQYRSGTASVVQGSQVVTGTATRWRANVQPGDAFILAGTDVIYDVATVQSDTQLTLAAQYAGETGSAGYAILRDFTASGIPEMNQGDVETPALFTRAMRRIQTLLGGTLKRSANLSDIVSPAAARQNLGLGSSATSEAGDYASAAQGSLAESALQPSDLPPNNVNATVNPTVDDDETLNYRAGSKWLNKVSGEWFILSDAAVGAADWQQVSLTVDELGALAVVNDAPTDGLAYSRRNNTWARITPGLIGADLEGSAAAAVAGHEQESDPHQQYLSKAVFPGLNAAGAGKAVVVNGAGTAFTLGTLAGKMIGEPFPVWDHISGVEPPDNSGVEKYIRLTAGQIGSGQYNEGFLTGEAVDGVAPLTTATALIATGPLQGRLVHLINTEQAFLGARVVSGVFQHDQMQRITGRVGFAASSKGLLGAFTSSGSMSRLMGRLDGTSSYAAFDSADSPDARTGTSTYPKNVSATWYMRIK